LALVILMPTYHINGSPINEGDDSYFEVCTFFPPHSIVLLSFLLNNLLA